jgi:hypothetical protein
VFYGALRCRAVSYGVGSVSRSVRRKVLVRSRVLTRRTERSPVPTPGRVL